MADAKRRKARRKQAINREVSAAKAAAGIRFLGKASKQTEQDWRRQMEIRVEDTRSLTGQILGDPIPGDPRRPWLNEVR